MLMKDLPYSAQPPQNRPLRELAAAMLRALGAALDQLALRLVHVEAPVEPVDQRLEFYAEAGAPEGALYVNGLLVGHVAGVTRL